MKTNKTEFLIKILFLLFLIGCSHATKTSFGLLKKTMKKTNTNNNLQNQHQSNNKIKVKQNQEVEGQAPLPDDPNAKPEQAGSNGVATLPDTPIYAQGWIKYLHYDDSKKSEQKMFWKNTFYEQEQKVAQGPNKTPVANDEVNLNNLNFYIFFCCWFWVSLLGDVFES